MKLTIESMTYGADGLAHADNGKAVFVQGAVAGDTVEAEVVQDGKSFMRARTTEILEPSPDRIQPPCPFVGICGGCSWGNLSRTAQLAAKEQICAPRSSASASSLLSRLMSWYSPSATPRTTGATAIKSSSNRPSSTVACALACTVSTPAKS